MNNTMSYNNYVHKTNSSTYLFSRFFGAKTFEIGLSILLEYAKMDTLAFSDKEIEEYRKIWNVKNRHRKIKEILE